MEAAGNNPLNRTPDVPAQHEQVREGMYARVGGVLVKINSVDDAAKIAHVTFINGDTEHVPYGELNTLVSTTDIAKEWEEGGGGVKWQQAA